MVYILFFKEGKAILLIVLVISTAKCYEEDKREGWGDGAVGKVFAVQA